MADRTAVALLALAFAAPAAGAEESTPLTLADALEWADGANPELAAARERSDAQKARGEGTARLVWPRVYLQVDALRTDNPARVFGAKLNRAELSVDDFAVQRLNHPPALGHVTTSLALEVPLDAFGKVRARARGETALAGAARAQAEDARQELRLRVVEEYRRAALAGAALAATERALEGARAREADINARVAEGQSLRADLLRARARRRQREADLAERQGDGGIAHAALARLLGAPPGASFATVEAAPAPAPLAGDLHTWLARALPQSGALRAAREREAAAGWVARGERRSRFPDISAFGQVQDDRGSFSPGQVSVSYGLTVRWSPFDPARGRRLAAATADGRAAAEEARAAADQVRLDVETAWMRAQSTRERHAAAVGGAEEGREALRVVQERRRAGMATLTDELETEAASLAAELEELRAAAEAALADAALVRAAGEL